MKFVFLFIVIEIVGKLGIDEIIISSGAMYGPYFFIYLLILLKLIDD